MISGRPERDVRNEFTIFSGSANPTLAATIARELGSQVGACVVDRYPDGDVAVQLLDSVRRKEVFLVQPTSPPVNDHLVELLALADACRRSGASRVSAIVPVFGYGRADKRNGKREPIMARVVADLLQVKGRPRGGQGARERYSCFDHVGEDTQAYGLMTRLNLSKSCEDEVISQLVELQRRAAEYVRRDGRLAEDEVFYAEQNARLVKCGGILPLNVSRRGVVVEPARPPYGGNA